MKPTRSMIDLALAFFPRGMSGPTSAQMPHRLVGSSTATPIQTPRRPRVGSMTLDYVDTINDVSALAAA
jgi:hypothetical protein